MKNNPSTIKPHAKGETRVEIEEGKIISQGNNIIWS